MPSELHVWPNFELAALARSLRSIVSIDGFLPGVMPREKALPALKLLCSAAPLAMSARVFEECAITLMGVAQSWLDFVVLILISRDM